jgi:hypothetical protein
MGKTDLNSSANRDIINSGGDGLNYDGITGASGAIPRNDIKRMDNHARMCTMRKLENEHRTSRQFHETPDFLKSMLKR